MTILDELAVSPRMASILDLISESTGLRIALLANVREGSWEAAAVQDGAESGFKPGDKLPYDTTY